MFSIVVPLYNKEKNIIGTLNTVLQQTFGDFELIIVDDGSTDNSVSVITEHFNDNRIRLIRQNNQGVSSARNKGIEIAKYPYIAFLDADDIWHPQYLEVNKDVILAHPDISIFGSDYEWIYPDEEVTPQPIASKPAGIEVHNYFQHALQKLIFWTSATVVKKADLLKVDLFNKDLRVGEDLDLWFRILLRFNGMHVPQKLAWYMRSDRDQVGPGKLVPLKNHLIGKAMDIYAGVLATEKQPVFNKFIYNFILSDLILYYFDERYHSEAKNLFKKIKFRYRLGRIRYILYFMPYGIANYLYSKMRRTRG